MSAYESTIVYPPEPKWCGGPVTWRVRAASPEEAASVVARLTEGRWAEDHGASPFTPAQLRGAGVEPHLLFDTAAGAR